jgi:dipeptidyl aminopeptidase/acylaminoacyl peptidase
MRNIIIPLLAAVIPLLVLVIEKCEDWDWCSELTADKTSTSLVAVVTEAPTEEVVPSPTQPPVIENPTETIVFISQRDGDNEIYALDVVVEEGGMLVTGGLAQLTDNSASDTYPSWSPDGSKLAFQSDQDGDYDIYSMDTNSFQITALLHNSGFDSSLAWSPDGSQIAFFSDRDGVFEIYVMDASGGLT